MRLFSLLLAASVVAAFTAPAMADSMSMMKSGEVMAVMPDGHMGTMMADPKMSAEMMKMAKPLGRCMMMLTGADGKMYMVDTASSKGMQECEKMAK
jgi:hypothetical protein